MCADAVELLADCWRTTWLIEDEDAVAVAAKAAEILAVAVDEDGEALIVAAGAMIAAVEALTVVMIAVDFAAEAEHSP